MKINLPRPARLAVYIITALGTPVVAYLNARGIIGSLEVGLWSAEVTVATSLAALNIPAPLAQTDDRATADDVDGSAA